MKLEQEGTNEVPVVLTLIDKHGLRKWLTGSIYKCITKLTMSADGKSIAMTVVNAGKRERKALKEVLQICANDNGREFEILVL